ncbi:hypothetical protein VPHD479_0205 [Vibrio phage D479]
MTYAEFNLAIWALDNQIAVCQEHERKSITAGSADDMLYYKQKIDELSELKQYFELHLGVVSL